MAVNTSQYYLKGDILPQDSDTFLSQTSERQDLSLAVTFEWVILSVMLKGIAKYILKNISSYFLESQKTNILFPWVTDSLTSETRGDTS